MGWYENQTGACGSRLGSVAPRFATPRRRARRRGVADGVWRRRWWPRDARSEQHASAAESAAFGSRPPDGPSFSDNEKKTPDHLLFVRNRALAPFFRAARERPPPARDRARLQPAVGEMKQNHDPFVTVLKQRHGDYNTEPVTQNTVHAEQPPSRIRPM